MGQRALTQPLQPGNTNEIASGTGFALARLMAESTLVSSAELSADLQYLRGDLLERALPVARELALTASARDRAGGTAKAERDLIRSSGLLGALVPKDLGGLGAQWPEIFDTVRLFSRVDSALGHVFGFQHLMLANLRLYGSAEQWTPLFRNTAAQRWFWGNALNPLDPGTRIVAKGAGFVIDGKKSFSSGSVDADWLIVSAHDISGKLVVAALPANRQGLSAKGDWDNIGQRQTDSGSVEFHNVDVAANELLRSPGPLGSVYAGLRSLIAQLTLSNVFLGLAEGALLEARGYTRTQRKAWANSGVESASADPYVLRHYGDFYVAIAGARALADAAAAALAEAYERPDTLSEAARGAVAVRVASAKVAATRAALDVTSGIFDVTGARATATRFNLDRFWRNARTHTLHDPVDYKLRELGAYALSELYPTPSFYS